MRNPRPSRRPRTSRRLAIVAGLGLVALAPQALARQGAPQPVRPISADAYTGRWYEVARTPNRTEKDCAAATTDFMGWSDGAFSVTETCHKGSPDGPAKVFRVKAKILHPPDNTRFRISLLGGLLHQEYWIIDHAGDNSWVVMGTPGGNYVWLLSRRPTLAPATLTAAVSRIGSLGYAPSRLIYPFRDGQLTANTP